jgi:hypothetical protein
MGVMQIINGIQSRNQRTRAEEDLLGIKPSWMTEYQRQNQDVETSVYAGASLFSRIFRPAAVITVSVLSLVVAIALTVSACS